MGAATRPRAPRGGKGLAPGTGSPAQAPSGSPQTPTFRLLLWSGDWMQAEAQPQIKASSLDRPPGRLLRLPPEQNEGSSQQQASLSREAAFKATQWG